MKTRVPQLFFAAAALSIGLGAMAEQPDAAKPLLPFSQPQPGKAAASVPQPGRAAAAPATGNSSLKGPHIQFATPIYEFGRMKSGDPIKHSFVFTNTGEQVLEIKNVRPGCGCTTAGEWTKTVQPGKTGSIPIQVNTANFNGPVTKVVNVDTSDPEQATVMLQVKGVLWKPIDVQPQLAYFTASADAAGSASSVVRIKSNMDAPLTLSAPEVSNKAFRVELKPTSPGKEYQVIVSLSSGVTNVGPQQATITMKTTSTEVPEVKFTAYANVQPAVVASPPTVALPASPLANKVTPVITIQNNGTNMLKLSDPQVSVKDVSVQLVESQPNKLFTATLTFPEGFAIPEGQRAEFTVKTSHPQYPVIKVPITQVMRSSPPIVPVKRVGSTNRPNIAKLRQALLPPPPTAPKTATQ